jgi:hypothetical protein
MLHLYYLSLYIGGSIIDGHVIRLYPKVLAGPIRDGQFLLIARTLAFMISPLVNPVSSYIFFMGIEQVRYLTTVLKAPLHSASGS